MYDITNLKSFNNIRNWINEIKTFSGDDDISVILVGNKCDLDEDRQVSTEEANNLANELGVICTETSAKNTQNVGQAFEDMAREIKNRITGNNLL